MKKCEFKKDYLIYIEHMIGGGELRVDQDNIATINQWLIPTSLIEVRSSIG
jgi:hypothetical protein